MQEIPVITFDQPLWWKALLIVKQEPEDSHLKSIVVRLGGFHTEMSFLGSVGHLMAGSGLSQILECIYASVEHLMSGKAISRAVRGHLLVDRVLTGLLLEKVLNTPFGITIGDPADNNNNNQELLTGQLSNYQNLYVIIFI